MKYISIDIRLGLTGAKKISSDRIAFHERVVRLFFPGRRRFLRFGSNHTSPFDYQRIGDEPAYIIDLVNSAVETSLDDRDGKFDLLLVDLSNNPYDIIRDPVLINLADVLEDTCIKQKCFNVLLLLPALPGKQTASMQRLKGIKSKSKEYRMVIIANNGDSYVLPASSQQPPRLKSQYKKLINELETDPATRFQEKVIRRLGHFRRAKHNKGCRLFSYMADNCEDEMLHFLKETWNKRSLKCDAILYDTQNNPSLSVAVKAFAEFHKLKFFRIEDVINDKALAQEAAQSESCLLVLDVIQTGDTLLDYATQLSKLNINHSQEVFAAISKSGNKETRIENYRVTSFWATESESTNHECLQCDLGLPHTSDDGDPFFSIRSFDMWHMAEQVGWEKEREVPENIGYGYEMVPNFTQMLSEFGDWIAYKMEKLYKQLRYPENFFIIHPDEPGANSVSNNLRIRFNNQLSIIKIPRTAIKLAQSNDNAWEDVIRKMRRSDWARQLESMSQTSAVITDIFNASGSTFHSIFKLLEFYSIPIFCYFPVVDRDCDPESDKKYKVPKFSLYKWYGPRKLKGNEGVGFEI